MEFITVEEATKDTPAERVAIPDAVVTASNNRDLVAQYVAAGAIERAAIEKRALELLAPPAPAAPSPQLALDASDLDES